MTRLVSQGDRLSIHDLFRMWIVVLSMIQYAVIPSGMVQGGRY